MAGVKGKSGRKTRYQEVREGNLLSVCTNWLIENFSTFDKETKIKVALQIASRGIIQKVEANVNYTAKTLLDSVEEASKQINRITSHV